MASAPLYRQIQTIILDHIRSGRLETGDPLPAEKSKERADGAPVQVVFTLKDGQEVTKEFRPDTANWFEAGPQKP